MGLFSRAVDLVTGRQVRAMMTAADLSGLPDPSHWAGYPTHWRTAWGPGPGEVWGDNGDLYERVSVVWSAVDLLCRSISQMPIRVMKGGLDVAPRPEWADNPHRDLYSSRHDFVEAFVASLLLRGNGFAYSLSEYSTGYTRSFMTLNPDHIWIDDIDGMPQYRYGGRDGKIIPTERLLHVRYATWPEEHWGYGPLDALARSLGVARELEQYAYDLAKDGAIPWGILSNKNTITREQARETHDVWMAASKDREGGPAILGGDWDLKTLSLSPENMALLELSTMSERRIAIAFGIQPWLLGIPVETSGTLTYANVSQVTDTLWRLTLRPLAQSISAALSQWALPYGSEAVFDADEFTRPDPKTRAETNAIYLERGVLTVDEVRAREMLPPIGEAAVLSGGPFVDTQQPGETIQPATTAPTSGGSA